MGHCQWMGKAQHETKGDAEKVIRHLKRDRGIRDDLVAFRCRACGRWHVGHGAKPGRFRDRKGLHRSA